MAATARAHKRMVLSLYKTMLRESEKFPSYNYREYAVRRIRDAFQTNKKLEDANVIMEKLGYGAKNLAIIRRQVIIGHLYSTDKDKLVIEHQQSQ